LHIILAKVLNEAQLRAQRQIDQDEGHAGDTDVESAPIGVEDEILTNMLIKALAALGTLDIRSISDAMRQNFAAGEVLALIQLLRQQLFKIGSPNYMQPSEVKNNSEGTTQEVVLGTPVAAQMSIDSILKVLSACIDAVGPLDLLSPVHSEDFLEHVIPHLMSEVSLATKAVEDTADVHGVLREALQYAQSNQKPAHGIKSVAEQGLAVQRPGEIITLYAEQMEDVEASGRDGLLPLTLQGDSVKSFKVRKGGGQITRRSLRHTLMLESRNRGLYSYERLVL
jgi:hypothetical protein